MEYLKLWLDSIDAIDDLDEAEAGRLFKALMHYVKDGIAPSLPGAERIAFKMLKPQIDREVSAYQQKCGTLKANGMKGGRPRKEQQHEEPIASTENQMVSDKNQMVSEITICAQEKEKEKDKEKNNVVVVGEERARTAVNAISLELTAMSEGNWDELRQMMDEGDWNDDVVVHAVDYTVAHGARTWAYLRKLLASYLQNKVKTVQDIIALEYRSNERKQQPRAKPVYNPWAEMLEVQS